MRHVAPENDYSTLPTRPGPLPTVAVIIPAFNRVGLLQRTLAGIAAQTTPPDEVIVVDDGSDDDIAAGVAAITLPVPVTVLRRERSGYGAGAARNLGAAQATSEVLLFLDADCLPAPGLVAGHLAWQRRADNLVVVGGRRFADTGRTRLDDLAAGTADLDAITVPRTDWRDRLVRRSTRLRHGTEAFRAVLSGNLSLMATLFDAVGGFDEGFTTWGGEDTELGWRLWQSGAFIIPDDAAFILHQEQEDEGDPGWRRRHRSENRGRLTDLIPHRFYRKDVATPHPVPKVSIVVVPAAGERSGALLDHLDRQRLGDWEVSFPLDPEAPDHPRVRPAADLGDDDATVLAAIEASRAEYVVLLSGRAAPHALALQNAADALDDTPRAAGVVTDIEGGWPGLPAFAVARRREWGKVLPEAQDLDETWQAIAEMGWLLETDDDPVLVGGSPPPVRRSTGAAERVRRAGPLGRAVYGAVRALRLRQRTDPDGRLAIRHLGDARSAAAIAAALPWGVLTDDATPAVLVVGGGVTLDDDLVDSLRPFDRPRLERLVCGATIAGGTGPATVDFLGTCLAVGVADLADVERARAAGFTGPIRRVGHPTDGGADDLLQMLTAEVAS